MLQATISVWLGLAFLATGLPKVLGIPAGLEHVTRYGYREGFARLVGLGEILAASALGWGISDARGTRIGATLVVVLMLGALYSHIVRGKEPFARWLPAASMLTLAAVLLGMAL